MNLSSSQPINNPIASSQIIICHSLSPQQSPNLQLAPLNMTKSVNYSSTFKVSGKHQNEKCSINYVVINNNYFISPKCKSSRIIKNKIKNVSEEEENDKTNSNSEDNSNIDEFTASIRQFVQHLEVGEGEQSIITPSIHYNINRRRLYDIVNVFESIGCCKKSHVDYIIWIGQSNIKNKFETIIDQKDLYNQNLSLTELFPPEDCIGVSNLTSSLILLFYALKIDRLDLRHVAHFFSQKSSRLKTTLNKLYQIAHIMSAINLLIKTSQIGEVLINKNVFNIEPVPDRDTKAVSFGSIESFLNNDVDPKTDLIMKRRKEFKQFLLDNKKQ